MGLDVYTHLVIGAEVKDEEIFVRSQKVPYKCRACPGCHAVGQKFCGECGHKFAAVEVKSWTPSVARYLEGRGLSFDASDIREYYGSLFHNVAAVQDCEENRVTLAVGFRFDGASSCGRSSEGRAKPIAVKDVDAAVAKVTAIISDMGLAPRETCLFQVMYVSF